jgi:uncharacterized protein (DUF433 family)
MASNLMEEAAKLRNVPGIIFAGGPTGRRARVGGTGIEVFEIIESFHQGGDAWPALPESYDWLTDEQLRAALAYYSAYPEEIEGWLRAEEAESLEEFWHSHPETKPAWR